MLAIVALDTIRGTRLKLLSLYGETLPAALHRIEPILLDNTDVVLPETDGGLYVVCRIAAADGIYTNVCLFRPVPAKMRFRQGEYFGVGIWIADAWLRGRALVPLLERASQRYYEILSASGRDQWDVGRLTLSALEIAPSSARALEGELSPRPNGGGVADSGGRRDLFVQVDAERRHRIAQMLDAAQTNPDLAGIRKLFTTSDPVIAAKIRQSGKQVLLFEGDDVALRTGLPSEPSLRPVPPPSQALAGAGGRAPPARQIEAVTARRPTEPSMVDTTHRVSTNELSDLHARLSELETRTKRTEARLRSMYLSGLLVGAVCIGASVLSLWLGLAPLLDGEPPRAARPASPAAVSPPPAITSAPPLREALDSLPCGLFEPRIGDQIDLLERAVIELTTTRRSDRSAADYVTSTIPAVRALAEFRRRCLVGRLQVPSPVGDVPQPPPVRGSGQ